MYKELVKLHELQAKVSELKVMLADPNEDGWDDIEEGLRRVEESAYRKIINSSRSLNDMLKRYRMIRETIGRFPGWHDGIPRWGHRGHGDEFGEWLGLLFGEEELYSKIYSWNSKSILIVQKHECRIESIAIDVSLPENPDGRIVKETGSEHLARLVLTNEVHYALPCVKCHLPGSGLWREENDERGKSLLKYAEKSAINYIDPSSGEGIGEWVKSKTFLKRALSYCT